MRHKDRWKIAYGTAAIMLGCLFLPASDTAATQLPLAVEAEAGNSSKSSAEEPENTGQSSGTGNNGSGSTSGSGSSNQSSSGQNNSSSGFVDQTGSSTGSNGSSSGSNNTGSGSNNSSNSGVTQNGDTTEIDTTKTGQGNNSSSNGNSSGSGSNSNGSNGSNGSNSSNGSNGSDSNSGSNSNNSSNSNSNNSNSNSYSNSSSYTSQTGSYTDSSYSTTGSGDSGYLGAGDQQTMPTGGSRDSESKDPEWVKQLITEGGETSDGFTRPEITMGSVDLNYSGQVDSITGEPVVDEDNGYTGEGRIQISDRLFYDSSLGGFIYFSELFKTDIISNVADGMIVTEPVSINLPEDVKATLYCNNEAVNAPDFTHITQPGSYFVELGEGSAVERLMEFTIVGGITGAISYYTMPEGFLVDTVTLDDVRKQSRRSRVEMLREGTYEIKYSCPKANIFYTLKTKIDHTPPKLVFKGLKKNGTARGKVSWEGLGAGESMDISMDGEQIDPGRTQLEKPGKYILTVMDQAGNKTIYQFTILLYLHTKGMFFGGLLALLALAMLYMQISRQKMRVR
ncbi:MAG: hypothetical protein K6E18_00570 [Lachnospiraceae bacterium]|nr:hypothetical protein [Lachnospiraceae bacterium]